MDTSLVETLYKYYKTDDNIITVTRIHGKYLVGITPSNGFMTYCIAPSVDEAVIGLIDKYRGVQDGRRD